MEHTNTTIIDAMNAHADAIAGKKLAYSDEIIKAHAAWRKAEDKVPDGEYEQAYEKRDKAAQRK